MQKRSPLSGLFYKSHHIRLQAMSDHKKILQIGILVGFILLNTFTSLFSQNSDLSVQEFTWNEHRNNPYSTYNVGVAVYASPAKVNYKRAGRSILNIEFKSPVMVYQATEPQGWGFVQFPRITRVKSENKIAILWNLAEDDIRSTPKVGWKYSKDNGKNWFFRWKERPVIPGILLSNQEEITLATLNFSTKADVNTTPFREIRTKDGVLSFYRKKDLKEAQKGIFSQKSSKRNSAITSFTAPVTNDSLILGYAYKGVLPVQAWGKLKEYKRGELVSVQYPVFQENANGTIELSGLGVYKSHDYGKSWTLASLIPYNSTGRPYSESEFKARNGIGLSEPAIEVLSNGDIICVFRTSTGLDRDLMYQTISKDGGYTWSKPKAIAKNGVSPQLLRLGNGVTVLTSGRPGVQMRFLLDNGSSEWTDAFEMLRFKDLKGQVSCGYTGLLALDKNRLLVVYSDFRSRDANNIPRKAILVREIVVQKL